MKILIVLLALSLNLKSAEICVDDDNLSATKNGTRRAPYSTIQSAIMNAAENDTIKVASGNYGRIDNLGKSLTILGGYTGGSMTTYNAGTDGDFGSRSNDHSLTVISAGMDSIGVNLTRLNFNAFKLVFDNFTVRNSRKGIVCDAVVSWPLVDNVTLSNNIIENNGQPGTTTGGGGIVIGGNHHTIINNVIRNNHGGRGAGIAGNRPQDTLLIANNSIENNTGYDDHCGGVYLAGYVTITHNIISGNRLENSYGWGGGMLILGTAHLSFNIFKDNYCPSYGGALFIDEGGVAYMDNELIYHNATGVQGAAVAIDYGEPGSSYLYMTNCTIVNNYSPDPLTGGNAVFVDSSAFAFVKNCIMSGNGDDYYVRGGSALTVSYTLSDESVAGPGNISGDPLFADTLTNDFHLQSTIGRYYPSSQSWVIDGKYSPAIDAGDPASNYKNEPTPNGNRIDLGCYGNTIYASKSVVPTDVESELSEQATAVTVFPNPTNGNIIVNVSNNNPIHGVLRVFNALGETVYQSEISEPQSQIALNACSGVYYFQLQLQTKMVGFGTIVVQ